MPNDPDWSIFEELSEEVPIIVADDSDGQLAPPPRDNVTYYDYAAQRDIMRRSLPGAPAQERGQQELRPLSRLA